MIIITKQCTNCGNVKLTTSFHVAKAGKYGVKAECKECLNEKIKQYHALRRERDHENCRKWRMNNYAYRMEYERKYRMENAERMSIRDKLKRDMNPEQERDRQKKVYANRRNTEKGIISYSMKTRIYQTIKQGSKLGRHWGHLVPFTVEELKCHLEKQFDSNISWDNYGTYWHIDHIIPIAVFNYEKPEDIDFQRCWSLTNLQPLEVYKNKSKGAKINRPFQPALVLAM